MANANLRTSVNNLNGLDINGDNANDDESQEVRYVNVNSDCNLVA